MSFRKEFDFKGNTLVTIVILALLFMGVFIVARSLMRLLYFLAPLLIIITLIVDYKVVVNYGKWLIELVRERTLLGIGAMLGTVLLYPVVFAFLLGKALIKRRIRKAREEARMQEEEQFVDFEELESKRKDMEMPPLSRDDEQSEYDDLFDRS